MNKDQLIGRIDDLLKKQPVDGMELYQATLSLLVSVYGQKSVQVESLNKLRDEAFEQQGGLQFRVQSLIPGVLGTVKNLKAEIECGLLGSLKQQFTGEILSDFIVLARGAAAEKEEGAKNVAAVLAAAAFEDTIRRLGSEYAGIVDRPKLSDIIVALKEKGILQGSQVGIAQSFLNFRNNSLHADWDKIEKASVESVLGFVEQLLLKHFG
jgi:hypothetical protein